MAALLQIQIQILYSWQIHKTWVFIVTCHEGKNEGLVHQQRSTIGSLAHLAHTRSLVLTILISQEMFPKLRPEATRIDIDW